ncbi:hypothetical protein Leryth_002432 [Lithospermum erythrorhizon]|nr:hypothetical protein Leryth_002432 [Lithospermum erythrorhizon]
MESKSDISSYRVLLDETLASKELKNEERLKDLVKKQMLQSSQVEYREYGDELVDRRTKEVANFLDMLRSTSIDDSEKQKASKESIGSWKVKQDTEEFRVMYREGPEGTPFHTLLVEGYVDGPVDVCLCISWEAALYRKWWPQSTVPSFKITSSKCLQRVRIGEQISLVRMKVSWPLSAREAVVHYFQFDYFEDGLVVVLLNSISDMDAISQSTHGFDRDGIPDADNVVRIDVVGGMAIQKVTANRSYFRTIANMDIKLDVVPPAFINFVSRQLIGSGFKLYKKEVASVSRGDEDFAKVLKDPQYERIREALYSDSTLNKSEAHAINQEGYTVVQERKEKYNKDIEEEQGIDSYGRIAKPDNEDTRKTKNGRCDLLGEQPLENDARIDTQLRLSKKALYTEKEPQCEIEEIEEEDTEKRKQLIKDQNNQISEKVNVIEKRNVSICPEVENALNTLDKAIELIRENKSNIKNNNVPNTTTEIASTGKDASKASSISNAEQLLHNGVVSTKLSKKECRDTSNEPRNSAGSLSSRRSGSSSFAREANQSKVAPASPDHIIQGTGETQQLSVISTVDQTTGPSLEKRL